MKPPYCLPIYTNKISNQLKISPFKESEIIPHFPLKGLRGAILFYLVFSYLWLQVFGFQYGSKSENCVINVQTYTHYVHNIYTILFTTLKQIVYQ